jgi:pectin methylesterase-like acyl-CoA thioesterase
MQEGSFMRKLFALVLTAVALALTVGSRPAVAAATLVVDDDAADCPGAGYTTVQSAVDDAVAGDTVAVCAGTYAGATVNKGVRLEARGDVVINTGPSPMFT